MKISTKGRYALRMMLDLAEHREQGFVSLKEIAARYGASITEYLSAVLLQSILENQEVQRPRRPRPAALAIPIDLRGWFR